MGQGKQENGDVERADEQVDEDVPLSEVPVDGGFEGWLIALGSFLVFLNTWV